jgi:hypothetical protein
LRREPKPTSRTRPAIPAVASLRTRRTSAVFQQDVGSPRHHLISPEAHGPLSQLGWRHRGLPRWPVALRLRRRRGEQAQLDRPGVRHDPGTTYATAPAAKGVNVGAVPTAVSSDSDSRPPTTASKLTVLPARYGERTVVAPAEPVGASLGELLESLAALSFGEDAFVAWATARVSERPPNYAAIIDANRSWTSAAGLARVLEAGPNRCSA